jgi:hypothetical protein
MPWRALGIALLVAFVAIQVVPVDRSNPPITETVSMTPAAAPILRRSCFDCHSNETRWPWYAWVAPVSWLVASDVHEGREELNFSTWDAYSPKKRSKRLDKLIQEVHEYEMPPWYYRLVHHDAPLSNGDLDELDTWIGALHATPRS